jgi:hypothetical protein
MPSVDAFSHILTLLAVGCAFLLGKELALGWHQGLARRGPRVAEEAVPVNSSTHERREVP